MQYIEKTKQRSYCCNGQIFYEHTNDGNCRTSTPVCSKCKQFPAIDPAALDRALEYLNNKIDNGRKN